MENTVYAEHLFDSENTSPTSERQLWRAVLAQAIKDMTNKPLGKNGWLARRDAISFLINKSPGFRAICAAAGYDADWAHEKFVKAINAMNRRSA